MKPLYETIFDTTATPEDFSGPEFLNNSIKGVKIESRTLVVTKSEPTVHIYKHFIEKMKQYELDTIKFIDKNTQEVEAHSVGNLYNGISIEAPERVILRLCEPGTTIGLSIKASKIDMMNVWGDTSKGIFKNCKFEAEEFEIYSTPSCEIAWFEPSCTLKVGAFAYDAPDDIIKNLRYDDERKTIVNFFDHLPGPVSIFKKIDMIFLQGYYDDRRHFRTFCISKKLSPPYNKKITLDVPGPWKYGGSRTAH